MIGISSWRCSSVDAFREIASFGRTAARPSSSIFGMMPEVETVMRRGEMAIACGSHSSRVALSTAARFSSGSPMPIITMFNAAAGGAEAVARA